MHINSNHHLLKQFEIEIFAKKVNCLERLPLLLKVHYELGRLLGNVVMGNQQKVLKLFTDSFLNGVKKLP